MQGKELCQYKFLNDLLLLSGLGQCTKRLFFFSQLRGYSFRRLNAVRKKMFSLSSSKQIGQRTYRGEKLLVFWLVENSPMEMFEIFKRYCI